MSEPSSVELVRTGGAICGWMGEALGQARGEVALETGRVAH